MPKGAKPPSAPQAIAPPVDPNANEAAKSAAAEAGALAKKRSIASSSEGSFGSSKDALGGAPTSAPGLKNTLGA